MPDFDPTCLFCRIAVGEIPSDTVLATDEVVVLRDVNPRAPTHLLAIPRRHIPSLAELTDADAGLLSALFAALRTAAGQAGLPGYRIVSNVGPEAGQTVFHLHFHLLGGRPLEWPPG